MARTRAVKAYTKALAYAAALAFAMALASCAARIPYELPTEPLRCLDPDARLYVKIRAPSIADLVPALIPPEESPALMPLIKRSEELGIAFLEPENETAKPGFEAVFVGNYPFRSASFSLSTNRGWRREGSGFANESAGIKAAFPGPTVVLAATGSLEVLVERLKVQGPNPIPARLAALEGREIVLYAPEPLKRLAGDLLGEILDIPLRGLLIAAERSGSAGTGEAEEPVYDLSVAFLMSDAESARIFRPAVRLVWYALVRSLFEADADDLLGARYALDGEVVAAAGLKLRASSLSAALSRLGGASLGGRPPVSSEFRAEGISLASCDR